MAENQERGKGKLEEIGGQIKKGVGNMTGNEQMEAEGRAQELKGEGRQETAKAVGSGKGMVDQAKGNLKQGVGNLTGNEQMQAEGKVDEMKGDARRTVNE